MKLLILILTVGLLSCQQPLSKDKKSVGIKNVTDTTTSSFLNADIKITGDFDGDGKTEWAYQYISKQQVGSPQDSGQPAEYSIGFSKENFRQINMDCCEFRIINEGD